jgi:hypothetical protein
MLRQAPTRITLTTPDVAELEMLRKQHADRKNPPLFRPDDVAAADRDAFRQLQSKSVTERLGLRKASHQSAD